MNKLKKELYSQNIFYYILKTKIKSFKILNRMLYNFILKSILKVSRQYFFL